jgi:hypothetical protein
MNRHHLHSKDECPVDRIDTPAKNHHLIDLTSDELAMLASLTHGKGCSSSSETPTPPPSRPTPTH